MTTEQAEAARFRVSGLFGRLLGLYRVGWIDRDLFMMAIVPAAAKLFVAHVLPLDKAVREAAHGVEPDGFVSPAETFWRSYAEGRLQTFQLEE